MLYRKELLFVDLSPGVTFLKDLQGVFAFMDIILRLELFITKCSATVRNCAGYCGLSRGLGAPVLWWPCQIRVE
jgi:hypothetical protein